MGKGGFFNQQNSNVPCHSWQEIRSHNSKNDRWIVIDDVVYDVTEWVKKHPGGERIIAHYSGQDATEAWVAFHKDKDQVGRFLKPLVIGILEDHERHEKPILKDFRTLRQLAHDMDLFRPSKSFFIAIVAHVVLLDLLGWWVMSYYGTGWIPFIIGAVLLATGQAQAGWCQHDFGHLSVFKSTRWNHWTQLFILNFMKGASCAWWNYRHQIHHAKPNIIRKDPDIRLDKVLLVGSVLPKEWGKKKKGSLPYHHQHQYFFFRNYIDVLLQLCLYIVVIPPLLLPLYFNYEIPYFLITRKQWKDLFWMITFFIRWEIMFAPLLGFWGVLGLFMFVRFLESHWFVWVTQMNHIPMEVDYDDDSDWVTMQLKATCNVDQSFFNDWFSGHLNFQIEHHLFPTMPRNNFYKIAPFVKSFCKKYDLDYKSKSLFTAFADIVGSLKVSGKMWYDAYNM